MAKSWWPLAVVAVFATGLGLWYSMDDAERARYYAILVSVPHSAFVVLGLLGISGEIGKKKKKA